MTIEERLTLCKHADRGGRARWDVALTMRFFSYLFDKPYSPKKENWDKAIEYWKTLPGDADAPVRCRSPRSTAGETLQPMVTWGTIPATSRRRRRSPLDPPGALEYMGLAPGTRSKDSRIDPALFIGSCHQRPDRGPARGGRPVARGRKAKVPVVGWCRASGL